MNLEEQVTTIEQSRRLLELGFDKDTASLNWRLVSKIDANNEDYISSNTVGLDFIPHVPCWTIGDMMSIIHNNKQRIYFEEVERYHWSELIISESGTCS